MGRSGLRTLYLVHAVRNFICIFHYVAGVVRDFVCVLLNSVCGLRHFFCSLRHFAYVAHNRYIGFRRIWVDNGST